MASVTGKQIVKGETGRDTTSVLAKVAKSISTETRAQKRIIKEMVVLQSTDQRVTEQLVLEMVDDNNVMCWRAKWYYDGAENDENASPTRKRLAEMLRKRGLDHIEFRIVFPEDYPVAPPLVYNRFPRLQGSFIFSGGGICAQALNQQHGWSCASRAQSLVIAVRSLLENAGCRLVHEDASKNETPYEEAGARADDKAISSLHSVGYNGRVETS